MTKVNGDGLDIPAALRRVKGEKPALPAKPAPATKPLSAKGAAQQRAGVKVTDKPAKGKPELRVVTNPAPVAPAKPAAETPEAKLAAGKAAIKAAKAGKPVGELLAAVKKHAKHFAHKNGWDLLLLQSDADLRKELEGVTSKSAAVEKMRKVAQALNAKRPKDQPAPERRA